MSLPGSVTFLQWFCPPLEDLTVTMWLSILPIKLQPGPTAAPGCPRLPSVLYMLLQGRTLSPTRALSSCLYDFTSSGSIFPLPSLPFSDFSFSPCCVVGARHPLHHRSSLLLSLKPGSLLSGFPLRGKPCLLGKMRMMLCCVIKHKYAF